ncbi:hypothetical protein CcCBS67573_g08649 [Chytriomyces confervae]|uniref:DnaJ homologue subfamily C member 28 conserved domain-containing protein n=1 Tax=Chytriomyces confervae TaxID=246404 RepID=A0A507EJN7_9FUNG|nr:hypothetical protein CcCBS67573_g08649 [Chytriomyces confervae]
MTRNTFQNETSHMFLSTIPSASYRSLFMHSHRLLSRLPVTPSANSSDRQHKQEPSSSSFVGSDVVVDSAIVNETSSTLISSPELDAEIDARFHNPNVSQILKKSAVAAFVENEPTLSDDAAAKDAIQKRFLLQSVQSSRPGADLNPKGPSRPAIASRQFLESGEYSSARSQKEGLNRASTLIRAQHAKSDAAAYKTPTQQLYEDYLTIRPTLDSFETLVDAQIARARRKGQFDDLSGRGKPIQFDTDERLNVHLSDTELIMNRMIKSQNVLPGWIEAGQEVDRETAKLRKELEDLARECFRPNVNDSNSYHHPTPVESSQQSTSLGLWIRNLLGAREQQRPSPTNANSSVSAESRWKASGHEWASKRIDEINAKIRDYNLQSPGVKKVLLSVEKELQKARSTSNLQ